MRIIVDKATGRIIDTGDASLQYDPRFFDNLDYPDGTIPPGEVPQKYHRDLTGNIIKWPQSKLVQEFPDEARADLVAAIAGAATLVDLKQAIIRFINRSKF